MKKLILIFIAVISTISAYSQEPADLPAGTTWGTARSWINVFKNASYDSLESHRNAFELNYSFIQSHADSIAKIKDVIIPLRAPITNPVFIGLIKINTDTVATLADLRSFQFSVDTTSLSARIDLKAPINNPQFTGVARLVTDTLATKADVRQLVASGGDASLVVGDGTAGPFFDGTSDGGQLLKFYGDNGFYTGLQGGAPTANRSYRLPIDPLPSAGDSSLINIDQLGNMGFVPHNHYVKVADTINAEPGSYPSLWMFQQGMSNKVFVADSNKTSKGGYVTPKALMDSINLYAGGMTQPAVSNLVHDSIVANAGNIAGVTLNGGTLTLTGADALTFETGGNYTYTLPQTSGGTLMLMSEIQSAIRDSLLLYVKSDSPVLTGQPTIPESFYLGSSTMNANAEELNKLNGTPGGLTATEIGYNDGLNGPVQDQIDSLWTEVNDTIQGGTLYYKLADTTIYSFQVGLGAAGDTANFRKAYILTSFDSMVSDTIVIDSVNFVTIGTSPDIDIQMYFDSNFNDGTPTAVFTSSVTVTSTTTGNGTTSFANAEIPPGKKVYLRLTENTTQPRVLHGSIFFHLRNRTY